jgi:hypothetical protein
MPHQLSKAAGASSRSAPGIIAGVWELGMNQDSIHIRFGSGIRDRGIRYHVTIPTG